MYCFKCGTKLEDGTSVCPACNQVQPQTQSSRPQDAAAKSKLPGRGFGIAGMVLGIVGYVYSLPILSAAISMFSNKKDLDGTAVDYILAFLLFSVFSVLALVFAITGHRKGYKNGISTSGIVIGCIGLVFQVLSVILLLFA